MPTRNVVLTQHQQQVIESLVEAGRYQNASEVLREGLRLVERREAEDAARLVALRTAAGLGFDDLDAGRHTDVAEADLADYVAGLGARADVQVRNPG